MWPPSQPVWSTWAGALLCSARLGHAGPSPVLGSRQACEDTAEAGVGQASLGSASLGSVLSPPATSL